MYVFSVSTFLCGGFPPRCDSVAVDFGSLCVIVKRAGGRRCTAAGGGAPPGSVWAPPGSVGAPSLCHLENAAVMGECRGNVAALGCGCHSGVGVLAEGHQGWQEELFFGRFGMCGESRFLPRGGSSAQTCYRLDRLKETDK